MNIFARLFGVLTGAYSKWRAARTKRKEIKRILRAREYDQELLELEHEVNVIYEDAADGGLIDLTDPSKNDKS